MANPACRRVCDPGNSLRPLAAQHSRLFVVEPFVVLLEKQAALWGGRGRRTAGAEGHPLESHENSSERQPVELGNVYFRDALVASKENHSRNRRSHRIPYGQISRYR